VFHALISHVINKKHKLFCTFIDFRRAFDSINHKCLWYKLIKCGIRGKLLNVIRGIYRLVKSRVKGFDSNMSTPFECILGVRQGECLSPFLFAPFINNMEYVPRSHRVDGICLVDLKLFILLYADDAVIFSKTDHGLQMALGTLYWYYAIWKHDLSIL